MRRAAPLLALLLAGPLLGCPKRVTVGGQEMLESEARARARAERERLRTELAVAPPARAAQILEDFAARNAEVPEASEALLDAARRWRAARLPERAAQALGQLLARYPLAAVALEAKVELGYVQLEAGRPGDGLVTLSSLFDKLPPDRRLPVARAAADAAERTGAAAQAVRFRAEAAGALQGAERERELERAVEDVDQLPFLDVARLREELPADSPVLPPLILKLARVRLHLRDLAGAETEARELLARYPDSPFAAEGKALLERLARRTQVQPNVLGVAVPLSGRSKAWGEAILEGVGLAIGDAPYRIVVKDTRGEPDGAAQAVEELVLGEGAIAVLGGVTNGEALRAAQQAEELQVPFLSLSKVERVTEVGPFVFRLMLTAEAQARALVDWAMRKKGMRRFAVMYPGIPYGLELAGTFWDEVEARGGEIRGAEAYEPDRTTFAPLVKSMVGKLYLDERPDYQTQLQELVEKEKDPFRRRKGVEKLRERLAPITDFDAVFIPDFASKIAQIAPALAVEDVVTATCDLRELERIRKATEREDLQPVQLLGANGWDDPQLVERAGRYVECAVFVDGFFAASQRPETRRFSDAFQAKFGHPPTILEASAHDAAALVRQALERGARTRDGLRAALAQVRGFPGATGDIAFDARREVQKPLFFLTVERGQVRELAPAEIAVRGGP